MITAVFAMGVNGEFGSNSRNGLPWGTIPEELENFYNLLENECKGDIILVGKKTYETAPPRLRRLFEQRMVLVYGRSEPAWYVPQNRKVINKPHKLITKIGPGLRKYAERTDIVAIGGKTVIEQMLKHKLVDTVLRSLVLRKDGAPFSSATVYLDPYMMDNAFKDAAIVQHLYGENELYKFVLEGIYL